MAKKKSVRTSGNDAPNSPWIYIFIVIVLSAILLKFTDLASWIGGLFG